MSGPAGFRLTKHYLDCIGPEGDVVIGYAATLAWGPLTLRYAAVLECSAAGVRRERSTWHGVTDPAAGGDRVQWACEGLGVHGEWVSDVAPAELRLLEDGPRHIHWHGVAPRARVELETGGRRVRGTGYVERLELTIEPWRLPFDTLYWGRFHAPDEVAYWIAWEGATRLCRIRHDDRWLEHGDFAGEVLRLGDDIELSPHEKRVVHEGPVIAAVAGLPQLLRRIPPAFASAKEVKWVSQASLRTPCSTSRGWLLHETVHFR